MKKITLILFVLAMAAIPVFARGRGQNEAALQQIKIGVSVPAVSHGWAGGVGWWAVHTVEELRREYPEIEFSIIHSDNAGQQERDLFNLATWGMNHLVIFPHESAPLTEPVRRIAAEGIRCIVVDRGLTRTDFGYVNIAGDNPGLGRVSGYWLSQAMRAESLTNYVAIGGMPVVVDTERMDTFFIEMNEEPSLVNLLGENNYEFSDWSIQDGFRIMAALLQQFPRIDAVYCQYDEVLLGVLQAISEARRDDVKIVLGGAGSRPVYEMIMAGYPLVRATGTYHPSMIVGAIRYTVNVALGRISADFATANRPTWVIFPSTMVTIDNVDQYYNPDSIF